MGTSLVIQWLRIHIPMQVKQGPSLVPGDSCYRESKQARAQLLSPARLRAQALQQEKAFP